MATNLYICHADSKNSPGAFWEDYMYLKHSYIVTGANPGRPTMLQIDALKEGDILMLNRNLGSLGGIVAVTAVRAVAGVAIQYNYDAASDHSEWIREAATEEWLVLPRPLSHTEIASRLNQLGLGSLRPVSATVNSISAPVDAALIDLFFEKYALKYKAQLIK
jgi:hypothetical protein